MVAKLQSKCTFLDMFIGHFAVGFAAKKFAPRTSMATLLASHSPRNLLRSAGRIHKFDL